MSVCRKQAAPAAGCIDYTAGAAPRPRTGGLLCAALACLLVLAGCRGAAEPAAPAPPNVVLLLVDTLRADALSTYGARRRTSPVFDALAQESFLFEQARAQASCTFPSANSLLTGLMPVRFANMADGFMGIPEEVPSLPERLQAAGYATAAVSASPIVRATPTRFNPGGGFGKGFESFDEACLWRPAECVNRQAFELLDSLQEPFFLYLHYMDPHDPYRTPEHWPRRFASDGFAGSEAVAAGDPNPLTHLVYREKDPGAVPARDVEHLRDLYDEEVAYFDFHLGKLLEDLEGRGLADHTLLVLVSDHGEEFFEHGHLKHCHTLYDTSIHTPLLIRLPASLGGEPPRRIAHPAANLDVVPTVLDYLGIEVEAGSLHGLSLRPAIEEDLPVRDSVIAGWAGLRAITADDHKLILGLRTGRHELYDLALDPDEGRNLLQDRRSVARQLRRRLEEILAATEGGTADDDRQAMERLRALGYVD